MWESDKILKHENMLALTRELQGIEEIRCINNCLVGQYQKLRFDESRFYPVDVGKYAEQSGLTICQAYHKILPILSYFRDTQIVVKIDNYELHTSVVHRYKNSEDMYTIEVQWDRDIIDWISGEMLPGEFVYVDHRMSEVSSSRRYLLYEFLTKYIYRLKTVEDVVEIATGELRDACGIGPQEYKEFKELNRRVIRPTLEDIYQKIGLRLEIKGGKRWVSLKRS